MRIAFCSGGRRPAFVTGVATRWRLIALLFSGAFSAAASGAHADSSLFTFLEQGNPLFDVRTRYEGVDDDSKTLNAQAYTLRARAGYETAQWMGFHALAEMDQLWILGAGRFNSTRNGKTAYPIVADPGMTTLNRLQLTYASDFDTQLIVGRQRILLADQRFAGNVGWRQHEQTFDAATATNATIPGLFLSYSYVERVNRIYGPGQPVPSNGPASAFHCDCHLVDAVYTVSHFNFEAFGLLLALDQKSGPASARLATEKLSTATFGARGEYKASLPDGIYVDAIGTYAHQSNYRDNPLVLGLNYWRGEANFGYAGVTGTAGYEAMQGNGQAGFSTPLATTHLFDGWADMFLTTPANGLDNFYVKVSYAASFAAYLLHIPTVTASIIHRNFSTDRQGNIVSAGLGTEWDGALEFGIGKSTSILFQFADYQGSGIAYGGFKDKSIAWVQFAYKY